MDQKKLLTLIKKALEKRIRVHAVYLFGSRARGTFTHDSDYDIAVVSLDFQLMPFSKRQELVRPILRKILGLVPLDVVCYTPAEYERGKKGFLSSVIEKEGIKA